MIDNFLFHKVSEKEKKEIKKQAKQIMDDFSKKLSKLGKIQDSLVERAQGEREEGKGESEKIDRKIMFENAPRKKNDFIEVEKGGWVE